MLVGGGGPLSLVAFPLFVKPNTKALAEERAISRRNVEDCGASKELTPEILGPKATVTLSQNCADNALSLQVGCELH